MNKENTIITSLNASEYDAHKFNTEASLLGWAPGYIPESIETTLGNKLQFVLQSISEYAFKYTQISGCIELTVYND